MAVIDDHIIVLPMDQDPKHGWESQFSSYKQGLMQQILASVEPIDYLINMPHVKLNIQENGKIVWLANFNLDGYQEIKVLLIILLALLKPGAITKLFRATSQCKGLCCFIKCFILLLTTITRSGWSSIIPKIDPSGT